jgi:hypothetical protein
MRWPRRAGPASGSSRPEPVLGGPKWVGRERTFEPCRNIEEYET